ncbi:MAG: HAD family phosphatase [Chloroflexi bacterium]|nr:MAG: HAD family phosphatase [Chloroflexota bacterium]
MTKINTVIFDVGGVLIKQDAVMAEDLTHELDLDQTTLKHIFTNQIARLGSGKIDESEFWRQLTNEYGVRPVDVSENLLGRAFAKNLEAHVKIMQLVKELGLSDYQLVVLSNTIEAHAKALRAAGIYDDFDQLFLSHEVGLRKPDPEIYKYVLNSLDVIPEATLFIDDDAKNVEAAKALGMNGIVFTNEDQVVANTRQALAVINPHV